MSHPLPGNATGQEEAGQFPVPSLDQNKRNRNDLQHSGLWMKLPERLVPVSCDCELRCEIVAYAGPQVAAAVEDNGTHCGV